MTFQRGRLPAKGRLLMNEREARKFRNVGWPRLYISVPRKGTHGGVWSVRLGRLGWWWGWYNR